MAVFGGVIDVECLDAAGKGSIAGSAGGRQAVQLLSHDRWCAETAKQGHETCQHPTASLIEHGCLGWRRRQDLPSIKMPMDFESDCCFAL